MSAKKVSSGKYTPEPTSNRFTYILGGIAILVIGALVVGGVLWSSGSGDPRNDGYGSVQNAAVEVSIEDDGAILLGRPDAPRTVDLFEDPLCPYCAELEHKHSQELAQAIDDGQLAIRYRMLAFLDRASSSGDYSTRAWRRHSASPRAGTPARSPHSTTRCCRPTTSRPRVATVTSTTRVSRRWRATRVPPRTSRSASPTAPGSSRPRPTRRRGRRLLGEATGAAGTPAVVYEGTVIDALGNENWVTELVG